MADRVFIISPPKTGGTVLTRMVCQHPDIEVVRESYSAQPDHGASIFNPESDKPAIHGVSAEQAKRWRSMVLDDKGQLNAMGWHQAMEELFAHVAGPKGATMVGDSWPMYGSVLDLIVKCYPDAKILYGTRDPRGIFWSGHTFMDRKIGQGVLAHALQFEHEVFKRRELLDLCIVRLEDLATDPDRVMEFVWNFLGLDPGKGWVDYDPERDPWPRRWEWIPDATERPTIDKVDRWREEMPPDAVREVSQHTLEYSQRHRYEMFPGEDVPDAEIARRFVNGTPLSELPEGAEEMVRGHAQRMHVIESEFMQGLGAILKKIDGQVQSYVDDPVAPGFERQLRFGMGAGLGHAGDMLSHLHNRITWAMMGLWDE